MSNILGPDVGISDMLNYHLETKADKAESDIRRGIHAAGAKSPLRPSSAGECERALAYKVQEFIGREYYEKKPSEAHVQLILGLGHYVEDMMIDKLKETGMFNISYEQQVLSFFNIDVGHPFVDGIVEGSNDLCIVGVSDGGGGQYKGVMDIKSKATGVGHFKKTKWDEMTYKLNKMSTVVAISETSFWIEDPMAFIKELDDPFTAMNLWQLNLYVMSEFMQARGFNFGSLLYFSKDSAQVREIRFKPSKEMYDIVKARFTNAARAAVNNDIQAAKREFVLGSSKCAFCAYSNTCWTTSEGVALKEYFATFPKKDWPTDLDRKDKSKAKVLRTLHTLNIQDEQKKRLEKEIISYMIENNLNKVQTMDEDGDRLIYELRVGKTTTSLKRSKV